MKKINPTLRRSYNKFITNLLKEDYANGERALQSIVNEKIKQKIQKAHNNLTK